MRKMMLFGLVAASLGLASCGATASLDQAVSSLGALPNLQLHFTGTVSGPGTVNAQTALRGLSIDMNYSNPTGAALSQSNGTANAEIIVNPGPQPLADVRLVGSNVYVWVNVSAVAAVRGVPLPATEVAALQLLIGERWFEFPKSLIDSLTPTPTAADQAQSVKDAAAARAIFDELYNLISTTKYTTLPNGGYSQTGTLFSVATAVLPTIESLSGHQISTTSFKGTYTLTVTTSGSTATGGSVTITAPSSVPGGGNDIVGLTVTAAQAPDSVNAPKDATILTKSLLSGLLSQAG